MKEKGSDLVENTEDFLGIPNIQDDLVEGSIVDIYSPSKPPPNRNLEGKGKVKWYDELPYDDFVDDLPMLRYVRGSKSKFTITTFDEINKICQQLFECNKSFFRFRAQVDLLAHYIGARILEQIYIVRKGKKRYPLSQLLENQEKQFEIWDQMKCIKELFENISEKYMDGFITKAELNDHITEYVKTFDSGNNRVKMVRIINSMIEDNAFGKAKDRNRKNAENKRKRFAKEIQMVK